MQMNTSLSNNSGYCTVHTWERTPMKHSGVGVAGREPTATSFIDSPWYMLLGTRTYVPTTLHAVMRNSIYRFMCRLMGSKNTLHVLIMALTMDHWRKCNVYRILYGLVFMI